MRRSAFTLIELLVIVAIIGIMVMVSVLGVAAGQKAVRVKGATRDAFAAIRHARSTALVTQQPAIITYSMDSEDGEPVAKIEITSTKLFDTSSVDRSKLQTITGAPIPGEKREVVHIEKEGGDDITDKGGGTSIEDILFAPISSEVVRGMRIKVVHGDELAEASAERPKSKISVFSNVDYLLGRYKEAKAADKAKDEQEKKSDDGKTKDDKEPSDEEAQEPVSIVWESNGRVEPHQVWIYPDGSKPEDGLSIKVDAFGGAKVVSGDGQED